MILVVKIDSGVLNMGAVKKRPRLSGPPYRMTLQQFRETVLQCRMRTVHKTKRVANSFFSLFAVRRGSLPRTVSRWSNRKSSANRPTAALRYEVSHDVEQLGWRHSSGFGGGIARRTFVADAEYLYASLGRGRREMRCRRAGASRRGVRRTIARTRVPRLMRLLESVGREGRHRRQQV